MIIKIAIGREAFTCQICYHLNKGEKAPLKANIQFHPSTFLYNENSALNVGTFARSVKGGGGGGG